MFIVYIYMCFSYVCTIVALFPGNYRASGPTDVSNTNCDFRKYGSSSNYILLQIKQAKTSIIIFGKSLLFKFFKCQDFLEFYSNPLALIFFSQLITGHDLRCRCLIFHLFILTLYCDCVVKKVYIFVKYLEVNVLLVPGRYLHL